MEEKSAENDPFECKINFELKLKDSKCDDSSIYYVDQGRFYQVTFKKSSDSKNIPKDAYFSASLEFDDEQLAKCKSNAFANWKSLHQREKMLEIDFQNTKNSGEIIYDSERPNQMGIFVQEKSVISEFQFNLKINCISSAFLIDYQTPNDVPIFKLIFGNENGKMVEFKIKSYWNGTAKQNYQLDFIRNLRPNAALKSEQILEQQDDNSIQTFYQHDDRNFAFILEAPMNLSQTETYLDKGSHYQIVLNTLNFINPKKEAVQTNLKLGFKADLSESDINLAISNWSLIKKSDHLFEIDLKTSQLSGSILDIYQNDPNALNIIWLPGNEKITKLSVKFNCTTLNLGNYFKNNLKFEMFLIAESFGVKSKVKLEEASCQIQIFDIGESTKQKESDQESFLKSHESSSSSFSVESVTIFKNLFISNKQTQTIAYADPKTMVNKGTNTEKSDNLLKKENEDQALQIYTKCTRKLPLRYTLYNIYLDNVYEVHCGGPSFEVDSFELENFFDEFTRHLKSRDVRCYHQFRNVYLRDELLTEELYKKTFIKITCRLDTFFVKTEFANYYDCTFIPTYR